MPWNSQGSAWRWRLPYGARSSVRRVREALEERGFAPRVVELDRTARSAAEAAQALGCRVEQIVKSLVFKGGQTGQPVLEDERFDDLLHPATKGLRRLG